MKNAGQTKKDQGEAARLLLPQQSITRSPTYFIHGSIYPVLSMSIMEPCWLVPF